MELVGIIEIAVPDKSALLVKPFNFFIKYFLDYSAAFKACFSKDPSIKYKRILTTCSTERHDADAAWFISLRA